MMSVDRMKGTVKWFNWRRGFGFITSEEGGEDFFVHKSSIKGEGSRSLTEGENIEFTIYVGNDGRSSAVDVTGPGGVCVQGRGYFGGACYRCNKVGHMARHCLSDISLCGLGPCYSCGEMGHLARECPFMLFANPFKPSQVDLLPSISPLGDMTVDFLANGRMPLVSLSEGIDSDEEDQGEESDEDVPQRGGGGERNWAELPSDVLLVIFKKVAAAEILTSAQFVCKPWRELSFVPALWRCIDMRMYDFLDDMESLAITAVDRSEGCLEELYVEYFPTEKLMCYITDRATMLRSLHLISVCVYDETLVDTVGRFPKLEELEISNCSFSNEVIEQVARVCPQLKSFRLNARFYPLELVDTEALAIAKHLKQLRHLQLLGNSLSPIGLSAILDSCPHLEYLDIRRCANVSPDENIRKKCARIKILRLPDDSTADYEYCVDDSTADYEYCAGIDEYEGHDFDFASPSSDAGYGFGYHDYLYYDYSGGSFSDSSD